MKGMIIALLLLAQVAAADVASRTYKAIGGSRYIESQDTPSCGKESRDLLKQTAQAARTITITTGTIRMNNGEPMEISERTEDTVSGMRVIANPTPDFPDRHSALVLTIVRLQNGDHAFSVARIVSSGDQVCLDAYGRSLD